MRTTPYPLASPCKADALDLPFCDTAPGFSVGPQMPPSRLLATRVSLSVTEGARRKNTDVGNFGSLSYRVCSQTSWAPLAVRYASSFAYKAQEDGPGSLSSLSSNRPSKTDTQCSPSPRSSAPSSSPGTLWLPQLPVAVSVPAPSVTLRHLNRRVRRPPPRRPRQAVLLPERRRPFLHRRLCRTPATTRTASFGPKIQPPILRLSVRAWVPPSSARKTSPSLSRTQTCWRRLPRIRGTCEYPPTTI